MNLEKTDFKSLFGDVCVCVCVNVWHSLYWEPIAQKLLCSIEAVHPDHIQKETLCEKSQAIRLSGQASTPRTQKTGERIKVQG